MIDTLSLIHNIVRFLRNFLHLSEISDIIKKDGICLRPRKGGRDGSNNKEHAHDFWCTCYRGANHPLSCRKEEKGDLLSVVSALAACVVWLFVLLNDNGAEY